MKTIIAIGLLTLVTCLTSNETLARGCKNSSEGFYASQIVSKLETIPVLKWEIDNLTDAILLRRRGVLIEIRKDGSLLSSYQPITLPAITVKKAKELYQRVICSKQSRNMQIIIKTLKVLGIDWRRWP